MMRIGASLPCLDGATEWFGATQAHAQADAKGQPTLIHFWSVSCGICKENLPRVAQWRDDLRERGLRVIAVHMPRYEADTDVEAVREAIASGKPPDDSLDFALNIFEFLVDRVSPSKQARSAMIREQIRKVRYAEHRTDNE